MHARGTGQSTARWGIRCRLGEPVEVAALVRNETTSELDVTLSLACHSADAAPDWDRGGDSGSVLWCGNLTGDYPPPPPPPPPPPFPSLLTSHCGSLHHQDHAASLPIVCRLKLKRPVCHVHPSLILQSVIVSKSRCLTIGCLLAEAEKSYLAHLELFVHSSIHSHESVSDLHAACLMQQVLHADTCCGLILMAASG